MLGSTPRQLAGHSPGPQRPDTNILTPEERHLMKERRRVEAMITTYNANPSRYDDAYAMQIEQYAAQYGIPFQRAGAGVIRNAGAAAGGFIDSFLWDLLPDSWYSSDATSTARKFGKGAGLASAALLTGGTSLLGKSMTKFAQSGVGQFTTAGAALGAKKMLAPTIAGAAKQGGMVGNLAETVMASGQGQNISKMAVKDITKTAKGLVKKGDKSGALAAIDKAGELTTAAQKVDTATKIGAVGKGLESAVYRASKGIGKGAATAAATGTQTKAEVLINSLIGKKGVGAKSEKGLKSLLADKNKVAQIDAILNDPNTDINLAISTIKGLLPKSVGSKAVNKSDIVKLLSEFYGFSSIGG
tara:strand:- start:5167 stop:6240 length:1074 start_codon:yes stop_codon:yes gene_type:complete